MSQTNITLTKSDKDKILYQQKYNPALLWLKIKDSYNFAIGDVLVKMVIDKWDSQGKHKYKKHLISVKSEVPKRYKVVHIDEYGVPYVKTMKVNDTLWHELVCLAGSDPEHNYFVIDPEYAEHLLLASEEDKFSIANKFKEAKKHRTDVQKFNKSIRIKIGSIAEAHTFLLSLKNGDNIWMSYKGDDDIAYENICTINDIKTVSSNYLTYDSTELLRKEGHKQTHIMTCKSHTWGRELLVNCLDLIKRYHIYTQQPKSYERKIK